MGLKEFFTIFHSSVWKYCKWIADRADHTNKGVTSAATCGENITKKADSFQKARLGGMDSPCFDLLLLYIFISWLTMWIPVWPKEFCDLRSSAASRHQLAFGWVLQGIRHTDTVEHDRKWGRSTFTTSYVETNNVISTHRMKMGLCCKNIVVSEEIGGIEECLHIDCFSSVLH